MTETPDAPDRRLAALEAVREATVESDAAKEQAARAYDRWSEAMAEASAAGVSLRSIATVAGVSSSRVQQVLRALEVAV